jgi:hypothetical protein
MKNAVSKGRTFCFGGRPTCIEHNDHQLTISTVDSRGIQEEFKRNSICPSAQPKMSRDRLLSIHTGGEILTFPDTLSLSLLRGYPYGVST